MTKDLVANKKAAPSTLERLGRRWATEAGRGMAYIQGMTAWLASFTNPHTKRANAFSVAEFFDWYEASRGKGRMPSPHEVTRDDAQAYVRWLTERREGLQGLRLARDPSQAVESGVYALVRRKPGCGYDLIRAALLSDSSIPKKRTKEGPLLEVEAEDSWGLDLLLASMVERKLLRRSPTMAELRAQGVQDGVDWSRAGIDFRPDPNTYAYEIEVHSRSEGEDRAGTVLRRIATLSSLWRHWIERGENTGEGTTQLKFNIWSPLVRDASDLVPSRQKAYRQAHTPTLEHWQALMATTEPEALTDLRDRAILCLLFWQGLRVAEICSLRRKHRVVIDDMECLRVTRKNSRVQNIVLEPESIAALNALDTRLEELAEAAEKRARRNNGQTTASRWERVLRSGDAPLIPAVRRWGANAPGEEQDDKPMTRQGVAAMLKRRCAMPADPSNPDGPTAVREEDWSRIHPHGFRHLAAKEARRSGADVAIIQATLGHESLSTTTRYVEEHDMQRIRLFSSIERAGSTRHRAPTPAVSARRSGTRRQTAIRATGVLFDGTLIDDEAEP